MLYAANNNVTSFDDKEITIKQKPCSFSCHAEHEPTSVTPTETLHHSNHACNPKCQKIPPCCTLTIATHLMMEIPRPDKAPQRPATVLVKHTDIRNPSQLKRNETAANKHHARCDRTWSKHPHVISINGFATKDTQMARLMNAPDRTYADYSY